MLSCPHTFPLFPTSFHFLPLLRTNYGCLEVLSSPHKTSIDRTEKLIKLKRLKKLSERKCVPCKGEIKPLQGKKLKTMITTLNEESSGWESWRITKAQHLGITFRFPDFKTTLSFVNKVGAITEAKNHHPTIQLRWGWVRIITWTNAINGLSENDFIIATKIGQIG